MGLAFFNAARQVGRQHVLDPYTEDLRPVRDEGFGAYAARVSSPYAQAVAKHFDPARADADRAGARSSRRRARHRVEEVQPGFRAFVARTLGDEGRAWLARSPRAAATSSPRRWQLELGAELPGGLSPTSARRRRGRRRCGAQGRAAVAARRATRSRRYTPGMAPARPSLLRTDEARHALLLERILPGMHADPGEPADVARTLQAIHVRRHPRLPPLVETVQRPAFAGSRRGRASTEKLAWAAATLARLERTAPAGVLLHGDFDERNLLVCATPRALRDRPAAVCRRSGVRRRVLGAREPPPRPPRAVRRDRGGDRAAARACARLGRDHRRARLIHARSRQTNPCPTPVGHVLRTGALATQMDSASESDRSRTARPGRTPRIEAWRTRTPSARAPTLEVGDASTRSSGSMRLQSRYDVARLPYTLRILLENVLRREDGGTVTTADVEAVARWDAKARAVAGDLVRPGPGAAPGLHRRPRRRRPRRDARCDGRPRRGPTADQPAHPHRARDRPLGAGGRLRQPARHPAERGARVHTQPRALRVPALGPNRVRQLRGRAAEHRHRPPGQPRVPRPRGRVARLGRPSPTRSSAPTRTRR